MSKTFYEKKGNAFIAETSAVRFVSSYTKVKWGKSSFSTNNWRKTKL